MIISEKDQAAIRERFNELDQPVVVEFFETSLNCEMCADTKQILTELCALNDKITLETYNLFSDEAHADKRHVTKAPVIHITDETGRDTGIYFYGAPVGYEFATLLQDIIMVSNRSSGLSQETRDALAALAKPVDLDVFVTPTCPYCPSAVFLAHQFAYESTMVTGKMVEATEFPEWANQFNVYGVPKTVMNETESLSIEGAVPEQVLLEKVLAGVAV